MSDGVGETKNLTPEEMVAVVRSAADSVGVKDLFYASAENAFWLNNDLRPCPQGAAKYQLLVNYFGVVRAFSAAEAANKELLSLAVQATGRPAVPFVPQNELKIMVEDAQDLVYKTLTERSAARWQ